MLAAIDGALWRWLIKRFGLMLLNAAFTSAGLWLLGVPFFLTLGLLSGVLNFIPNIGPLIAAIPAALIGLMWLCCTSYCKVWTGRGTLYG